MEKTIYLVDGNAYIYRAYHAITSLSNSQGLPTNAVFGFINILRRILREREPQYLAIAFDTRGPVFRHRIYPEYKATRSPMPDDLVEQIPYIKDVTAAYNFTVMEDNDQEADDLIASAAVMLADKGNRVVVVSGDKDLLQLVSDKISMWDPMNDRLMDIEAVTEKYGVKPNDLLNFFALIGDKSDNIPGVPGVGPKTAQKLISQYKTLETLYESVDGMKPSRMKERLIDHQDDAYLSRKLIRLNTKALVPQSSAEYIIPEPDRDKLKELFTLLEFSSLLKSEASARKIDYECFSLVQTEEQLAGVVEIIRKSPHLVLDTETTSLDPLEAELVGISLCVDTKAAWYIPCGHCDEKGNRVDGQLDRNVIIEMLRPFFEDPKLIKIGHNLKYDYSVLRAEHNGAVQLTGPFYDTMIGAYLLEPGRRSYKLDVLCHEIGLKMTSFKEVVQGDKRKNSFSFVGLEDACNYSCEDVFGTLSLFEGQLPKLKELHLWNLFTEIECPLVPVLAEMELAGITVDTDMLEELSSEFAARLAELKEDVFKMAGREFNVNSPAQLAEVLFQELKLPTGRKTKTGYSTDMKVLEKLSKYHDLPQLIIEYRNLAKLKSTYVDKLTRLVSAHTGRVHTSFNQCVTTTGRLSSSNPNLQNIPIRGDEGARIRAAFIAAPGTQLISADYSQIDLRVLAHFSEDKALLEAFHSGQDIHSRTAAEIFMASPALITSEMRRVAKTINFGIVYGMSSYGLATQLNISRKEAQTFIDRYFGIYSGVQAFMGEIVEKARQDGFVTTLFQRRRMLPDIKNRNRTRREFAERTAINTPIQGTAADIIKLAMLRVNEELGVEEYDSRMLLQIHDELVLETPDAEIDNVKKMLKKAMESVCELKVPLVVNVTVSPHLGKV